MTRREMSMPVPPPKRPPLARLGLLVIVLSLAGCSLLQNKSAPTPAGPYHTGLARLAEGDFGGADQAFRESASRCESGPEGRRSLLFLSLLALDPRNPEAHPDSAALMAARVLNLPSNTPDEAMEAEALYVAALDRGADPDLRLDPAAPGMAVRFGGCDEPFPPRRVRPLPVLDGPAAAVVGSAGSEIDALMDENRALHRKVQDHGMTIRELRTELEELQAELSRLRQLMRLPDTSTVRSSGRP